MKKIILTCLIALISLSLYSQDTISKPTILLRVFYENGIDFIRNDRLKQHYETQSKYFWGGGLQFGHPETFKIIPYAQFSWSKFEIEKATSTNVKAASALTTKQITGGFIIPLKKIEDIYIRTRLGYSYSMITESFFDIDSNSHGFQIGFGVEKVIIEYSRIYFDLSYNYQKTGKSEFRDFDMIKFSVGFVL